MTCSLHKPTWNRFVTSLIWRDYLLNFLCYPLIHCMIYQIFPELARFQSLCNFNSLPCWCVAVQNWLSCCKQYIVMICFMKFYWSELVGTVVDRRTTTHGTSGSFHSQTLRMIWKGWPQPLTFLNSLDNVLDQMNWVFANDIVLCDGGCADSSLIWRASPPCSSKHSILNFGGSTQQDDVKALDVH